ncbi:MAG: LPS export ABC transporter permease LptF [Alphaproteobacteria bacterium]|nr:LPS export ABC transporter permease LptF [Alphaproteobacteria bacterium]MBQ9235274.1 LPS export ABC transporter permease LptF [Alphaproteobacteria bacterium]
MKKLNVYIFRQIVIGFLLVSFSLMSIIWLSQSLRFLDLIVSKGISAGIFVKLTSLLMPRIFTILAPIALFASVLFVYNRMLIDQELVVMKSAGISPWQLAKAVVLCGAILAILNVYIMNIGIPKAEAKFKELEWRVKNNITQMMFREGEFTKIQDNLTVFISKHDDDGTVKGIIINDERSPKTKSTTSAEKGLMVQTDQGPRIILINGSRQEVGIRKNTFSSVSFSQYSVDFGLQGSRKRGKDSARTHSFEELITALSNPTLSKEDRYKWFTEANRRITTPLLALVYALIACTGLLISNFNRRGQTKTIGTAIASIVIIQAIDLVSGNQSAKHLPFLLIMYANVLLPISVCITLLLKPDILNGRPFRSTLNVMGETNA